MKALVSFFVCLVAGHLGLWADEQSPATKRLLSRFEKGRLATNPSDWGKIDFDFSQVLLVGLDPEMGRQGRVIPIFW